MDDPLVRYAFGILLAGTILCSWISLSITIRNYKALLKTANVGALVYYERYEPDSLKGITSWYITTTTGMYWTGKGYTNRKSERKIFEFTTFEQMNHIVYTLGFSGYKVATE